MGRLGDGKSGPASPDQIRLLRSMLRSRSRSVSGAVCLRRLAMLFSKRKSIYIRGAEAPLMFALQCAIDDSVEPGRFGYLDVLVNLTVLGIGLGEQPHREFSTNERL